MNDRAVTDQELRDAGFTAKARSLPRDDFAMALLCAFVGLTPEQAPPGWWFHPNQSSKDAWLRVAEVAKNYNHKEDN